MQDNNYKRNLEIDLLRVVLSIVILFFHANFPVPGYEKTFVWGWASVEFFFIISGYYMMNSISREEKDFSANKFMYRKLAGFYPEFLASLIISFGIINYVLKSTKVELFTNSITAIKESLLLQCMGFGEVPHSREAWYLSAMIFGMIPLIYILKKIKGNSRGPILALIICISYELIKNNSAKLSSAHMAEFAFGIPVGIYRAIGGLSIGALIFIILKAMEASNIKLRMIAALIIQAIALVCTYIFIFMPNKLELDTIYQYWIIPVAAVYLFVVFSKSTGIDNLLHKIFKNEIFFSKFFNEISLLIYLSGWCVQRAFGIVKPEWSVSKYMQVYLIATVAISVVTWVLSIIIRKAFRLIFCPKVKN